MAESPEFSGSHVILLLAGIYYTFGMLTFLNTESASQGWLWPFTFVDNIFGLTERGASRKRDIWRAKARRRVEILVRSGAHLLLIVPNERELKMEKRLIWEALFLFGNNPLGHMEETEGEGYWLMTFESGSTVSGQVAPENGVVHNLCRTL